MKLVHSTPATYKDLREFHSELYLDHLKRFADINEEYEVTDCDEEYGIGNALSYLCKNVSLDFLFCTIV